MAGQRHIIWRAKPTLRGALATPRKKDDPLQEPVLFPWVQIGYKGNSRQVCDASGEALRCGGRPVELRFGPLDRTMKVAERVHRRAYRQAWERGQLRIAEPVADRRGEVVAALFHIVFVSAPLLALVVAAVRIVSKEWMLPLATGWWLLGGAMLLAAALAMGIFAWPAIYLLRMALCVRPIREMRVDAKGIFVRYSDNSETLRSWSAIDSIGYMGVDSVRLWLRDGGDLTLRPIGYRTRLALGVIDEHRRSLDQKERDRQQQDQDYRRLKWRLAIYGVGSAIVLGSVGVFMPPGRQPQPPGDRILMIVCITVAPLLLVAMTGWSAGREMRFQRRRRR